MDSSPAIPGVCGLERAETVRTRQATAESWAPSRHSA